MPDRTIRERARKSEKLSALSAEAERLWWRLVTMVDDYGRIRDNPVLILAEAFPLLADRISVEQIDGWLSDLANGGLLKRYRAAGVSVLWLISWDQHQDISTPIPSELPGIDQEERPGKPRRVISKPRRPDDSTHARTQAPAQLVRARAVSLSYLRSSNSKTGSNSGELLQLDTTGEIDTRGDRGYGGKGGNISTSRHLDDVVMIPEDLDAFDTILRDGLGPRYNPTARFFERVQTLYANVPGMDLEYQAEGMVSWLTTNTRGKKYTDIPRFADSWLERRADDLASKQKRQQPRIPYNGNGTGHATGRPYGMGGPVSDEARETARRIEERSRALGDD